MTNLYLPLSIALGIATWGLVARWYVYPWMATRSMQDALTPLLLINVIRYVGLAFLIPGVTSEVLDTRFSVPAAWGDLSAAILALFALIAVRRNSTSAITWVWVFNIFGFADLLNAVAQGLRYTVDGHLGATYFIPALFVPLLLVTHVVIATWSLRNAKRRTALPARSDSLCQD